MNGVKQPNPWDVSSIFEFNYFVCPECDCKIRIKQDFINHAVYNHPWALSTLQQISDNSLDDIDIPDISNEIKKEAEEFELPESCLEVNMDVVEKSSEPKHEVKVEQGEIKCKYCNIQCSSRYVLYRHIKKTHKNFFCNECGHGCHTEKLLKKHMLKHHDKEKKVLEESIFKNEDDISRNEVENNGNKDVMVEDAIKKQEESNQKMGKKCDYCGQNFKSLHRHIKEVHNIFCKECGFVSASKEQQENHERMHLDERFLCRVCNESFKSLNQRREHIKQVHGGIYEHICSECDEKFCSDILLQRHFDVVHGKKEMHECEQCDKKFYTPSKLRYHVDAAHLKIKRFKKHFCEKCGKSFTGGKKLKEHILMQHNDGRKDFQCDSCGSCFANDTSLQIHKKEIHNKHLKCDRCDKLFSGNRRLQQHISEVHGSKDHKCPHCDFCCTNSNYLRVHINNSHKRNFECNECLKCFGTQNILERHVQTVHSTERPYKCEACKEAFNSKPNLEKHMKHSHDQTRPFECSVCQKTFHSKEKLDHHFARAHELRNCESCPHCGKQCSRLKAHLLICKAKWSGVDRPRFECKNCGNTYSSTDSLRSHMKNTCKMIKMN